MNIIDFRARPGPVGSFTPKYFEKRPHLDGKAILSETIPQYLKKMNQLGIDMSVLMGRFAPTGPRMDVEHKSVEHKTISDICKEYPDRFKGIAGVDASWQKRTQKEIEEIATMDGMVGICLETGWNTIPMYLNDARLYPVYDTCGDLDLLVVFTMSPNVGPNVSYGIQLRELDQVAYDFKNVKFVVTHGAWPCVYEVLALAVKHKNVYISADSYLHGHAVGSEAYVDAVNKETGRIYDQFLFGSTYPLQAIEKVVGEAKKLPFIDDERRQKYLWKNSAKLLKLKV